MDDQNWGKYQGNAFRADPLHEFIGHQFVPMDSDLENPYFLKKLAEILIYIGLNRRQLGDLCIEALITDTRYTFVWRGTWTRFPIYEDELKRSFHDDYFSPTSRPPKLHSRIHHALYGDQSYRWIDDIKARADKPITLDTPRPRVQVLPRIRCLVMMLQAAYPDLARLLYID